MHCKKQQSIQANVMFDLAFFGGNERVNTGRTF